MEGIAKIPTPWTVDVTETGVYLCAGVEDVAEFRHSGRHGAAISQEEAVANATLAAAAPGLLQAAEVLVSVFYSAALSDALLKPFSELRAAIAAATRKLP